MARRPRRDTKPRATRSASPRSGSESGRRPKSGRQPKVRPPGPLLYKVVELSTVDEGTLERTLNEWSLRGWSLDGIQFAMRESSKRPAMAFVLFTREGPPESLEERAASSEASPVVDDPRARLARLAERPDEEAPLPVRSSDPWQRLRELAEGGDEPEDDA